MKTRTTAELVTEFHRAFGLDVRTTPVAETHNTELRLDLLAEEFNEYQQAIQDRDVVAIADALADMVYVIHGTALDHGIDLESVLAEVHRSNMSKLGTDGQPVYRADGKVLKGPNYFRPEIARVLGLVTS